MTGNANTLSSSFIDCIIDRMIELSISQSELARRMKVSSPYVTKLLNRDINLSFATASKLAAALGLDFMPLLRHPSAVYLNQGIRRLHGTGRNGVPPPSATSTDISSPMTLDRFNNDAFGNGEQ